LVDGSGRLGTRAMTSTTSADRPRLSSTPSCIGQAREIRVRQDRSQRPSSPALISRSRGLPRRHQRQVAGAPRPRQEVAAAADSEQIAGIVETMALGGAISPLQIASSALAPSTRPVRPHPPAEARQLQLLSQRRVLSQRQVLSHAQGPAATRMTGAHSGPPMENARRIPVSCWSSVVRAVVPAPRQHRHHLPLRPHHRRPRRGHAPMIISYAQVGQPAESVR